MASERTISLAAPPEPPEAGNSDLRAMQQLEEDGRYGVAPAQAWRPTEAERKLICNLVLSGLDPHDIAGYMNKSPEQIKRQLKNQEQQQLLDAAHERATDHAGFAMAKLQLELPGSADRLIAIARDAEHKDHFNAVKYHLDLGLASRVKQPEQSVNMTLNITQNAAALLSEQLPKYVEARGESRVEHPSNNIHLHRGDQITESRKAQLALDSDTPSTQDEE